MSNPTQLVRYDEMCRAIAAALSIDEVKDIRDKARAIEMYARQAQNYEAEEQAKKIRLRAERECGKRLTITREAGEMAKGSPGNQHTGPLDRHEGSKTLSDMGISYDQSSQWQKLAAVPEEMFEQALAEPNASTEAIIMRHEVAERPPRKVMNNYKALWFWGTLNDFESEGIFNEDPNELLGDMLDFQRKRTLEMADRVMEWMGRITK